MLELRVGGLPDEAACAVGTLEIDAGGPLDHGGEECWAGAPLGEEAGVVGALEEVTAGALELRLGMLSGAEPAAGAPLDETGEGGSPAVAAESSLRG